MGESLDGDAGVVVKILRFDEKGVARADPEGAEFGFLPLEMMNFSIKIE